MELAAEGVAAQLTQRAQDERRDKLKARGRTKEILKKVGEVQTLVGMASMRIDTLSQFEIRELLEKAHEKCIEVRDMYEPID